MEVDGVLVPKKQDVHAEMIVNILENDIVTGKGALAKMAPMIREVCQHLVDDDKYLQGVAVIALIR